jgi:ribosome-binding protein aMBF1 (putative translation factor)
MVNYCNRCGISSDEVRLYDAISSCEIVSLCKNCLDFEGLAVISRPTTSQLREVERKENSSFSSVKRSQSKILEIKKLKKNSEDVTLKDIVEKNYVKKVKFEKQPRPELIDNFHWTIMVSRRKKKLSQEFVAKEIGESELAIKMAEKGILPEDDYKLIRKLEAYLGIELIKKDFKKKFEDKKELDLEKVSLKNITISDLKKLKEEKEDFEDVEEEEKEENLDYFEEECLDISDFSEKDSVDRKNKFSSDLNQRDIESILFRS